MNLLFSMSLAGSLVFLVYLAFRPAAVRYFSSAWRYRMLKLALLFYLLPYQYFKYRYYEAFSSIFFHKSYQSPEYNRGFVFYDPDKLILIDAEGNFSLKNGKMIFAVLAVWGVFVISFVVYQVIKYLSCKRDLGRIIMSPDADSYAVLDQCRRHARMKKKIGLFCCSYINTPFTIGIFSPRIILPATLKEKKSFQAAISHELTHIRNHDILIKFTALLAMALHWFNPLTYLLYREICKVYECVCDETVTRDMTPEEKENYKLLIVEMAQKAPPTSAFFANALSSNFKIIQERITLMDKSMISTKLVRFASFTIAVLLLALSPLPVLAYSPMITGRSENSDNDMSFDAEYIGLINQDALDVLDIYDPFLEFETDYDVFVDNNGDVKIIPETLSQTERSSCNHIWDNTQIVRHYKNNDGSCTVNTYEAQMCSKCNIYTMGNLINYVYYAVCPH